ncbi:MAG: 2-oxo-4-hydroxy-4-carboxy-5-ureidoimidazoline decarboxylase [Chitinophagales bacterium]
MTLSDFNQLTKEAAYQALEKCCVASTWINRMVEERPFRSENDIVFSAARIWYEGCNESDFKEAFTGHPKIGDVNSLKAKYAATKDWAGNEQSSVAEADDEVIHELAQLNDEYEKKFGYIFIVSATGKSAAEMLQLIKIRIQNNPATELAIAMGEQHKITHIRLTKLMPSISEKADNSSHITTHVLDTSTGVPGQGMVIKMKAFQHEKWETIALGITNADGRIANLLPPGKRLSKGNYIMEFDTDGYYKLNGQVGFYPEVQIQFKVMDESHYHIPLLLNPYGYTTYRGS